jgi:hypothetical protein
LHKYNLKKTLSNDCPTAKSFVLFKTPNCPNIVVVVLIVVVLIAIVEILFPRIVVVVLCRTPVPISRKPDNINKSVLMFVRNLTST